MNQRFLGPLMGIALCCSITAEADDWFIRDAHIPTDLVPARNAAPLVIAIVDDGIDVANHAIAQYLHSNPKERPDNRIDDDGNGFIDDIRGWDFGDNDADIHPPGHRLKEFYHGTHLAGILIQLAKEAYGENAHEYIRIMPIKCVSDTSQTLQLDKAYAGIEYAINNGADLILCAWSLNVIADAEKTILDRAKKTGIQIVASCGNIPQLIKQFPAAHPAAMAVGAHDKAGRKLANASYGSFVDLTAPGEEIASLSANGGNQWETHSGTSQAAAVATSCMAIMKLQFPDFSWDQIKAALMNSSTTTTQNPRYAITMGAGKIHLQNALKNGYTLPANKLYKPKGYIPTDPAGPKTWSIGPFADAMGFRFNAVRVESKPGSGRLNFYREDGSLHDTFSIENFPDEVFVPGNQCRVEYLPNELSGDSELLLAYGCDPINYSTLYASGTKYLNEEGFLSDGSGPNPYSPETDAKWIITAPQGKVVHFEFSAMDIEPVVDKIYFFNGDRTNAPIMAVFSGTNIPPELTTWSNQVLIWFVTDGQIQGDGWELRYTFVDPQISGNHSED